jgi:hypothetical protein
MFAVQRISRIVWRIPINEPVKSLDARELYQADGAPKLSCVWQRGDRETRDDDQGQ